MNKLTKSSFRYIKPYRFTYRVFSENLKEGEEKSFIRKEEMMALQRLLKKVKQENNSNLENDETSKLTSILVKFNVTPKDSLITDLKNWKEGINH